MAEEVLTAAAEPTTAPQESAPADTTPTAAEDVQPNGEGTTPPEGSTEEPAAPAPSDDIEYRFNHETKTVSRKDAPALIQKLLKVQYDAEQKNTPRLDRLRFLAEASGTDLDGLLDNLEKSFEDSEYRRFLKETNGNEKIARELAETAKARRTEKFRTSAQLQEAAETEARDTLTKRMGEELADLQAEFPEIGDLSDLPDSVVTDASEHGVSLLDGYLRYLHRNAKKAAAEKQKQEKAATAAVGSLRGAPDSADKADEQSAAFSAAFKKHF
jgi:hypothetical protein